MFAFFAIFALTFLGLFAARYAALKYGFVDIPDSRKKHEEPVPPIGGLVVFTIFICVSLALGLIHLWPLYLALLIVLIVGALDDWRGCPPWPKFIAQICVALIIVVLGDIHVQRLGNLFGLGNLGLNIFALPLSVIAVVLLLNAVNLMDGLDGLAGGYGLSVFLMLLMMGFDGYQDIFIMVLLIVGVAAFLCFNMRSPFLKRAKIFLGDAGSLAIGACIAWFAIDISQVNEATLVRPIVIAWMLAFPIMDTCAQFYRRVREGKHPFTPDRGHLHYQLIDGGCSVPKTVWSVLLIQVSVSCAAYLWTMYGLPEVVLTLMWIAALFGHLYVSRNAGFYTRLVSKNDQTT